LFVVSFVVGVVYLRSTTRSSVIVGWAMFGFELRKRFCFAKAKPKHTQNKKASESVEDRVEKF